MAQPMYRQIAEDLRGPIEAGRLAPGARLPTEDEFRMRYNASRNGEDHPTTLRAASNLASALRKLGNQSA
jgi:DNA-binding GntR family transcriptional regulator